MLMGYFIHPKPKQLSPAEVLTHWVSAHPGPDCCLATLAQFTQPMLMGPCSEEVGVEGRVRIPLLVHLLSIPLTLLPR